MRILDAEETRALLPYAELAREIGEVLELKTARATVAPERLVAPVSEAGLLLAMPASDGVCAVVKLATVHLGNRARGLPAIQGEVVVMDASDGRRLCLLDGPAVTAARTAAVSLLAAQRLAPVPEGPLLVIGGGVQGRAHLEAFAAGLGVRKAWIASRNRANAEALAAHGRTLGLDAEAVDSPARVLDRARLLVTATSSATPVLSDRDQALVRDDCFIAAVGAFKPEMAELPASLVRRSALYADTQEGARTEAGDLILAGVDWDLVTPLERVGESGRDGRGPVFFECVGHALFDLAAGRLALRGLGLAPDGAARA
jgi:ornithine cyclodeaminase